MDLRIFPNAPLVPLLGTVEEVGASTITFLAKKPRSQRCTRMVVPIKDVGWYIQGGSKLEKHPDVLHVRPSAFRQEPMTYIKNVQVDAAEDLRTFRSDNRSVVVCNEELARVSCQEDVATDAEKRKQPKAARASAKAKAKAKSKAASKTVRGARRRKAAADDFED